MQQVVFKLMIILFERPFLTLNGHSDKLVYNSTNKYTSTNAGLSREHRRHKRLLRAAHFNIPSKHFLFLQWIFISTARLFTS
jgi:hypothetical protein